jgi:hypothetical protein
MFYLGLFARMICTLEEYPRSLIVKLPKEIWLIICKYVLKFTLKGLLTFPILVNKPRFFEYYSIYWQASCGDHCWYIESGGPLRSSLIDHKFRKKRVAFHLAGLAFVI